MPRPLVRFPAYRQFSEARVEVNDAMMALMIGARLGEHFLANSAAAPDVLLPTIFGRIRGIERLNRTASDAAQLLAAAEGHLTYMAIPYALSAHGVFLIATAELVRSDGLDDPSRPGAVPYQQDLSKLTLECVHEYLEDKCQRRLSPEPLALFHLSRRIRNRIVHFGGRAGSRLIGEYKALPKHIREMWEDWTKRPLDAAVENGRLELREGELIAVLASSRHLAQEVNVVLAQTISRDRWADLIVDDYKQSQPQRFGERAQLARRIQGLASKYYSPLAMSAAELEAAVARSREAGSSY